MKGEGVKASLAAIAGGEIRAPAQEFTRHGGIELQTAARAVGQPASPCPLPPTVRHLGTADYLPTWRAMQEFTARRNDHTTDELWLLQHPPVYTVGVAGRSAHLPRVANGIPLVAIDRGGQITYHGPGQIVLYTLLDLTRRRLSVRAMVRLLERAVIDLLARYRIEANSRADAPGVYVNGAKVAALGLRVRKGCCYHGLALNVDMDLSPFLAIDPCGYPGMAVTCTRDLGVPWSCAQLGEALCGIVADHLSKAH